MRASLSGLSGSASVRGTGTHRARTDSRLAEARPREPSPAARNGGRQLQAALTGRARERLGSGRGKSPTARSSSPAPRSAHLRERTRDGRRPAAPQGALQAGRPAPPGLRCAARAPQQPPGEPRPGPACRDAVERHGRGSPRDASAPRLDRRYSPWSQPPAASFSEAARREEEARPNERYRPHRPRLQDYSSAHAPAGRRQGRAGSCPHGRPDPQRPSLAHPTLSSGGAGHGHPPTGRRRQQPRGGR
jgi:hypothetical protein